eukprot:CAMPEP_0171116528 /NCGR_PEP_ID=MMETSP0766_2-20121228/90540_1 /TAXON_ID=439317 /ORGANISM="Gambierdiscus australes, Strain CAWD 149" /LENGTH=72 /DNA_ID=CAMNT_0011578971 /DNA_START=25 /DNA_END=240 /DNA_ORIENTATION=+
MATETSHSINIGISVSAKLVPHQGGCQVRSPRAPPDADAFLESTGIKIAAPVACPSRSQPRPQQPGRPWGPR